MKDFKNDTSALSVCADFQIPIFSKGKNMKDNEMKNEILVKQDTQNTEDDYSSVWSDWIPDEENDPSLIDYHAFLFGEGSGGSGGGDGDDGGGDDDDNDDDDQLPKLKQVTFNNVNDYYEEPIEDEGYVSGKDRFQPGPLVSPQDWLKGRDSNPAVFYSTNSNSTVSVVMSRPSFLEPSGLTLSLIGTGPDGIKVQCNDAIPNVDENTITVSGVPLTGLRGNGVRYYQSMNLSWKVSINGGSWIDLGNSADEMYVSLNTPTTRKRVVTEVHIAVCNAQGAKSSTEVINKLVAHFSGLGVSRKNGQPLGYYHPNWKDGTTIYGLIFRYSSRCDIWTELFQSVLGCHAIATKILKLETIEREELMHIKNYDLETHPAPITRYPSKLTLVQKLPGQNTPNPRSDMFPEHYLVEINKNHFFDPSYGKDYKTDMTGLINNAFIEKSVSAFSRYGNDDGDYPIRHVRAPRNDGTEITFRYV